MNSQRPVSPQRVRKKRVMSKGTHSKNSKVRPRDRQIRVWSVRFPPRGSNKKRGMSKGPHSKILLYASATHTIGGHVSVFAPISPKRCLIWCRPHQNDPFFRADLTKITFLGGLFRDHQIRVEDPGTIQNGEVTRVLLPNQG